MLLDKLHCVSKAAFVPDIVLAVLLVVFVRLVDGVVGEVHAKVTQVTLRRRLIFNSR